MFPPSDKYFLSFRLAPKINERLKSFDISKSDLAIKSVLNTLLLFIPSVKYPWPNVEPTVPGLKNWEVLDW